MTTIRIQIPDDLTPEQAEALRRHLDLVAKREVIRLKQCAAAWVEKRAQVESRGPWSMPEASDVDIQSGANGRD
jgi:hypothetical protein